MLQNMGSGLFILVVFCLYLFVIIFVLTMLWRIADCLKHIAHNLYIITKEVKKLSERSGDDKE